MQRKKKGAVEWLEFDLLSEVPGLAHGVFLRHGGVSEGPYASLNAGAGIGDLSQHVENNRKRIQQTLGLKGLFSGKQVHGKRVELAISDKELPECDGLITHEVGKGLLIKHADCQAALFCDPIRRVIGNVHAGWRGNVQNIYAQAVSEMKEKYNSRPEDLLVGISPSLGPVMAEFKNYKTEFPPEFWDFQVEPNHFDLWAIARMQLEACGILPHHIEIASMCTYENVADCFSYRREKNTGRHASVIGLL